MPLVCRQNLALGVVTGARRLLLKAALGRVDAMHQYQFFRDPLVCVRSHLELRSLSSFLCTATKTTEWAALKEGGISPSTLVVSSFYVTKGGDVLSLE